MSTGQTDPTRLGGGLPLKTPFGVFYPEHFAGPGRRDRRVVGGRLRRRAAGWRLAGRPASLSGLSLSPPTPGCRKRTSGDLYAFLKTTPAGSRGRAPPDALTFPFSIRRADRRSGSSSTCRTSPARSPWDPAGPEARGRALYRRGAGPLRRMPFPAYVSRRGGGSPPALTGAPLPEARQTSTSPRPVSRTGRRADIALALSDRTDGRQAIQIGGPMAAVVRNLGQVPDRATSPAIAHLPQNVQTGRRLLTAAYAAAASAAASERMRSTIERTPLDRCGVRCCSRPSHGRRHGVRRRAIARRAVGIKRQGDGDEAAHQMRVAVAAIMEHRLSVGIGAGVESRARPG